jgi:hypothetical protein
MTPRRRGSSLAALCLTAVVASGAVAGGSGAVASGSGPDFDREVLPILAQNCFACHGPDANKRQADLRLDTSEGARQRLVSGRRAVVPGDPVASEVLRRIVAVPASDPRRMPPIDSHKTVTAAQTAILTRWIAAGAVYRPHWAFVAPRLPKLPIGRAAARPIDAFVRARLQREGLKPALPADRATLIRRVSLDLIGLPPTPEETAAFLADRSPGAYENVVDRLLASSHYGERMALGWLDLARYADTHGYHIDSHRDMYRWRDWVIDAFNRNLPYDRFVTEQLAGDLLPNATREQRIATGFNRNHPINFEGGAIPEEYAVQYVADRVDTTATAFLGLTVRCAQCHDHKYDPVSMKDYYRFFAFFNNVPEEGLDGMRGNAKPFLSAPYPEQEARLAACVARVSDAEARMHARHVPDSARVEAWLPDAIADSDRALATGLERLHAPTERLSGTAAAAVLLGDALSVERTDPFSVGFRVTPEKPGGVPLSRMDSTNGLRGWDVYLDNGNVLVHLIHHWPDNAIRVRTRTAIPTGTTASVLVTYDGSSKAAGVRIYVDGALAEVDADTDSLTATLRTDVATRLGGRSADSYFTGSVAQVRLYRRMLDPSEVERLARTDRWRALAGISASRRTPEQNAALLTAHRRATDPEFLAADDERTVAVVEKARIEAQIPTTMVMEERKEPRTTHLLRRGQYDQPGDIVSAGTPEKLPGLPGGAHTRLDLARWLVSPQNPLTARVAVNRLWQQFFGTGLVRTAENFGTQGEPPSHPELLDWLAVQFRASGWDVKAFVRELVLSETYRQSSACSPELRRRDPENRLLARAARLRLPAELVRDQALAASGLLVEKIGGPSVKTYQPDGLWEEMSFKGDFTAQYYVQDHGEALWRRSLYTFWKRTVPPPSLQTLDAPEREFCVIRRSTTNTPLQALVLMNDPTYVEAARKLAERTLREASPTPERRIARMFSLVLARAPRPTEVATLARIARDESAALRKTPGAAKRRLAVGESPVPAAADPEELAAWAAVASVVLNLDEAITRG